MEIPSGDERYDRRKSHLDPHFPFFLFNMYYWLSFTPRVCIGSEVFGSRGIGIRFRSCTLQIVVISESNKTWL